MTKKKPKLAVFKFASCDGCQLSLLDCEDELLGVADRVTIANFAEATSHVIPGPYDVTLVEGSITNEHDLQRIKEVRSQSKFLVTIGACATAGGIQALRNFTNVKEYLSVVYAKPEYINALAHSHPVHEIVKVDYELRGCPVSKTQLLELLLALLTGRKPMISDQSVCHECKLNGQSCIALTKNIMCMGPVTHAGCGAICPRFNRGCYGCFGPKENANTKALADYWLSKGHSKQEIYAMFRGINAWSDAFKEEAERLGN